MKEYFYFFNAIYAENNEFSRDFPRFCLINITVFFIKSNFTLLSDDYLNNHFIDINDTNYIWQSEFVAFK